jgi:hypothetical protein
MGKQIVEKCWNQETVEKGDRMIPLRTVGLSLLNVQRDPACMFVEIDDVLNVER